MIVTLAEEIDKLMATIRLNRSSIIPRGSAGGLNVTVPEMHKRNNPVAPVPPIVTDVMLLETGTTDAMLAEDGGFMLLET